MTDKEYIWTYLKTNSTLPDPAIAGIMGNLEAESSCESCRLQGDFTAGRTLSRGYAAAVDGGSITLKAFASDAKGWGLAQWTYPTRKRALAQFCTEKGKGIADLETQLAFMLQEMKSDYPNMWSGLLTCTDLSSAADLMVRQYERPAVINLSDRVSFAQSIYNSYASTTAPTGTPSAPSTTTTVPTGTPSAPSTTTTVPTGTPSAPSTTTTVPTGTPSAPSTTTVPTGTSSAPSGPSTTATVPIVFSSSPDSGTASSLSAALKSVISQLEQILSALNEPV